MTVKQLMCCHNFNNILELRFLSNFPILIYLQLPVKFDECTPEQQKQIRLMRLPKGASKTKEEFVATFDPLKYL